VDVVGAGDETGGVSTTLAGAVAALLGVPVRVETLAGGTTAAAYAVHWDATTVVAAGVLEVSVANGGNCTAFVAAPSASTPNPTVTVDVGPANATADTVAARVGEHPDVEGVVAVRSLATGAGGQPGVCGAGGGERRRGWRRAGDAG